MVGFYFKGSLNLDHNEKGAEGRGIGSSEILGGGEEMVGGTQGNNDFILLMIHRNEGVCSADQPLEPPRKAEREVIGKGRCKTETHPDPASRQQEDAVKFGLLGKEREGEEMEEFR